MKRDTPDVQPDVPSSASAETNMLYGRRSILVSLGIATAALYLPSWAAGSSKNESDPAPQTEMERAVRSAFVPRNPEMLRFAENVYRFCIEDRIVSAEPPFRHAWLTPGGGYRGQWIWDTTFITDLLAILPGQVELIRGIYDNFWDFQDRWSHAKPEYARGMIANFIAPDSGPPGFNGKRWLTFPAYSQAPLLGWGVERVYRRNRDQELVRTALPHLEAFHDWYWRERDLDNVGLVTVGSYDGKIQDARFETYDNEVDLDTLQLTPHPGRAKGPENGPWYGNIYIPANTSYLLLSEMSLIKMAKAIGDHALAARRRPFVRKGINAMRRYMWDESQGCFLAVRRPDLRKLSTATVGGMVPLYARIPTKAQATRMAEMLAGPHWNTPLPVPTVDARSDQYRSGGFWRGDVWPATSYQVIAGLAKYGHRDLAANFSGRLLDDALKVGISEHYNSQTGAPLGVRNLGMSSVLLTLALEGLNPRHAIRVA